MAAPKSRARSPRAAGALPPVTVARFEESLELVERIARDETDSFLQRMQEFRQQHRDVTRRPLTAEEATRFAAAMADAFSDEETPDVHASRLQNSDLYSYEEPSAKELLVAAGLGTAPALVRSVRRFVALMEMPPARFAEAFEDGTLVEAIDEDAAAFVHITLPDARARTMHAFEHWGTEAGVASGEVMRSLIDTVMGALEQAAIRVSSPGLSELGRLSTLSPEPTAGDAETSSTTSATATP